MTLRLKRVDGSSERYASLLKWLQLETLPADEPMSTHEGHWWIAFDGDQPVAFAGLTQSKRDPEGGYLCRAGVLPSARGKGLQRRLTKAREAHARKQGWRWLYSDTFDNPHSTNNLIAAGFRAFEPAVKYGLCGTNYWRKAL
jgi:GNAT superfamily N-acetyltransferase